MKSCAAVGNFSVVEDFLAVNILLSAMSNEPCQVLFKSVFVTLKKKLPR